MTQDRLRGRNPAQHPDHVWMVPAINVLLIRNKLLSQKVSEVALLRGTGISLRDIQSNDSLLTFDQVAAFMANAARLTTTPGLGLNIGSRESPSDWGALGYAMLSCTTIEQVIQAILRYHQTAASMVDVVFTRTEELAILDMSPIRPLHDALPLILEEHLSATKVALEMLAEQPIPLLQVNLTYDRPDYYRLYQQHFQCPVYFEASRNQLVFDASFLQQSVSRANAFNAKLAQQICKDQLARQVHEPDFVTQVRYLLLLNGNDFPDAETVSERLSITSRTLRNRLRRYGTSFQYILDDVRKQLACNYLASSHMRVDDIANLLNYSDHSNFRRAFKAWTGLAPSEYRQRYLFTSAENAAESIADSTTVRLKLQ
ncbi:MAG: AraC family transcriptional regulator [Parahaliea sp.]